MEVRAHRSTPPAALPQPALPILPSKRLRLPDLPRRHADPLSGDHLASSAACFLGRHEVAVAAVLIGTILVPAAAEAHVSYQAPDIDEALGRSEKLALAQAILFEEGADLARNNPDDAHAKELQDKVSSYVDAKFDGDYRKGFDHFDRDDDGALNRSELYRVLEACDVGNFFTRSAWIDGILERCDANENSLLSWTEFAALIER